MNKNSIAYHIHFYNKKIFKIDFIIFQIFSLYYLSQFYDMLCYGERK